MSRNSRRRRAAMKAPVRAEKAVKPTLPANTVSPDRPSVWWPVIREPFTGAWQRNMEERPETVMSFAPLFRCVSLISGDVAKNPIRLVEKTAAGIWEESYSPAFSPVLRKPNDWQNRIQFFANWMESKLLAGNTYVLKERDDRGVVVRLYILDPRRVKPLVTPMGDVYYQLYRDDLAGVTEENLVVPAREIIHDRWNCHWHPLVGISPIIAAGLSAMQGIAIKRNSSNLFTNASQPGGILTAPGNIDKPTAERLKEQWEQNFGGANSGRVAVVGNGMTYERMAVTAVEAQLIEQLKWTAEDVCTAFGVPPFKIGVGPAPAYTNIEALEIKYYSDCLQTHFESIELCLDEGLGLDAPKDGRTLGTEFDLDNLLRMDSATLIKAMAEGVRGGILAPNEGRRRLNYKPVAGGDTPYLQHQDYSLAALAKRDAKEDPFATGKAPSANDNSAEQAAQALAFIRRGLHRVARSKGIPS